MQPTRKPKQLKSSSTDLREFAEHAFAVRHVAEDLASFDNDRASDVIRQFMHEKEFDVVGVRRDGVVNGYVQKSDLGTGAAGECERPFENTASLSESAPIGKLLPLLVTSPQVFVTRRSRVTSIVTRGDLQKAPFRMWLFGLVSLLEMQLLRLIRECYPTDAWKPLLSPSRLQKAEEIYADRCKRNEHIDLTDCLQFCDKRDIVLETPDLVTALGTGIQSATDHHAFFRLLENLRNDLAHGQDIVSCRWPELADLMRRTEEILMTCETITFEGYKAT